MDRSSIRYYDGLQDVSYAVVGYVGYDPPDADLMDQEDWPSCSFWIVPGTVEDEHAELAKGALAKGGGDG